MKLGKQTERTSKARAMDVLQTPEPERQDWDFDVMRDVPARVWDWADKMMEKLITNPSTYELFARDLCRLAAVNPELRLKLRNSPELRKVILNFFKTHWEETGSQSLDSIHYLADFLLTFPEFRDLRTDIEVKFKETIKEIRSCIEFMDANYSQVLVKMLMLFPEKQSEILMYAQGIKQELLRSSDYEPSEFAKGNVYSMELSASARLLFPEKTPKILKVVQPHWKAVLRPIQQDDPNERSPAMIFPAFILSAESATITPEGNLHVVPRPKQIQKRPELPVRPTT